MFNAPNKSFNAAKRYQSLIDVRVGTKQNSYREHHVDAHYLFARNRMRRELSTLFSSDITAISVDDMAKIKVGGPAVSRYHQADSPNLNDHNFPVPGYLLKRKCLQVSFIIKGYCIQRGGYVISCVQTCYKQTDF